MNSFRKQTCVLQDKEATFFCPNAWPDMLLTQNDMWLCVIGNLRGSFFGDPLLKDARVLMVSAYSTWA